MNYIHICQEPQDSTSTDRKEKRIFRPFRCHLRRNRQEKEENSIESLKWSINNILTY